MSEINDAIVAGGGVAGSAAAAALARLGYRVLVVEPGIDHSRRLAGELLHPRGVSNLEALGLFSTLQNTPGQNTPGVKVSGFAMVADRTQVLPYSEVSTSMDSGFAIEHGLLAQRLLDAVEQLPNVTVMKGARVTALDASSKDSAAVTIANNGSESQFRTKLVVAADGRGSQVRRMGGIAHKQMHLSTMVGFLLSPGRLPYPGLGHVFAGGPSPVLAYAISHNQTRVMFDLPDEKDLQACVNALPYPLRSDVEDAMKTQTPLRAANDCVIPEAVFKGRLVCVGDAGGCCHPISATGLTACTRDALLLGKTLSESNGDIAKALRAYADLRKRPQRTRMAGAELLYEVLKAATPEMQLLRNGLLRYWQGSERGRSATMALLSTEDDRFTAVVREYLQVCRHALPGLVRLNARSRAMMGLSRTLLRFLQYA